MLVDKCPKYLNSNCHYNSQQKEINENFVTYIVNNK